MMLNVLDDALAFSETSFDCVLQVGSEAMTGAEKMAREMRSFADASSANAIEAATAAAENPSADALGEQRCQKILDDGWDATINSAATIAGIAAVTAQSTMVPLLKQSEVLFAPLTGLSK